MANPKYADLPGIAHDQPDVYETTDLPEAEQGNLADIIVDQCDSVETLKVSPDEAYNKFKGKTLDSKYVDFTDGIGDGRKTGYDVRSGDWEMLGDTTKEKETPLQAYNRIQFETKQLFEEVNRLKESSDKESESSQVPPVALLQQIESLQKELQDLHMEKVLGSEALAEMSDPLGSLHKKLAAQLESFKKVPLADKKVSKSTASSAPAEDVVKYELFVRPDHSKLEQASKLATLEQRLKNLESIIGQDKKKWSFLTSNTDGKSITGAINVLSSKLNLLEPSYLDQVENRLVVINQCMQQVAEKKHQIEDVDKLNKVAELYELTKKVHELDSSLPQVVERLVSLKELHEQALQFSKALTQLDTSQQQITNSLKTNETLLKEVQATFLKNTEMIESNIASLNSRIAALK